MAYDDVVHRDVDYRPLRSLAISFCSSIRLELLDSSTLRLDEVLRSSSIDPSRDSHRDRVLLNLNDGFGDYHRERSERSEEYEDTRHTDEPLRRDG